MILEQVIRGSQLLRDLGGDSLPFGVCRVSVGVISPHQLPISSSHSLPVRSERHLEPSVGLPELCDVSERSLVSQFSSKPILLAADAFCRALHGSTQSTLRLELTDTVDQTVKSLSSLLSPRVFDVAHTGVLREMPQGVKLSWGVCMPSLLKWPHPVVLLIANLRLSASIEYPSS